MTEEFIESLYRQHKGLLLGVIRRYLGQTDGWEDVFQDVFVKILRCAPRLRALPPQKLETYLILMARGTAIDHLRKRKLQPMAAEESVLQLLSGTGKRSPLKMELALLLGELPREQQVLLIGKYYLGLSLEELAELTGGTAGSVKLQLHRTRKKLLAQWKGSGLNLGDFIDGV